MSQPTPILDDDGSPLPVDLDVDGTIAAFAQAFCEKAEELGLPYHEHYSQWRQYAANGTHGTSFSKVWPKITGSWDFWYERIDPLQKAHVTFPVNGYVTSRSQAPDGATREWIIDSKFPNAPVHVVGSSDEKIPVLRESDAEIYVDDKIAMIESLQKIWTDTSDVPYPVLITSPANAPRCNDDTSKIWTRVDYLTELPEITIPHLKS